MIQKKLLLSLTTSFMLVGCFDSSSKIIENSNAKNYFTTDNTKMAFSHAIKGLNNEEEDKFVLGKSFFSIPWVEAPSATTARDGLGPLFNANSCKHCHPNNGAGVALDKKHQMSRSLLLRLSHQHPTDKKLLKTVGFEPDSTYGAQLSRNGNAKVAFEGQSSVLYRPIKGIYKDGTTYSLRNPHYKVTNLNYGIFDKDTIFAPRIGLALIGLGLLEKIKEKDILANEDIEDKNRDGISGKANYAFDPETNSTRLGRFTWKASAISVKHQTAGASHNDMGLSNPFFPSHNCTQKQIGCLKEALKSKGFDLPMKRLEAITFYLSSLAIPKQREPKKHLQGKNIFKTIGCIACHKESYMTSNHIKIFPYSDLLLHDMGETLGDKRREFLANGNEWRTPPLWGIGLYKKVSKQANYLHDGRARSIEEAILWHKGEAEASQQKFISLDKTSREKLLGFLNSI